MTKLSPTPEPSYKAAEFFRLSLAKLGSLKIDVTPTNYALVYYYIAGDDIELNAKLDKLFASADTWSDEAAKTILLEFIQTQVPHLDVQLRHELLITVAQILGLVTDLSGVSALSNKSLTKSLEKLTYNKDPKAILGIASEIVAGTSAFVNKTKEFETTLKERNDQIQKLHNQLDTARKQASIDALTGLQNRRGFDEALKTLRGDCSNSSHNALLLLDIDHFKHVNDNFGHLVGDKILVGVSKQLANQMGENEYLARFGGEEFAILVRDTTLKAAVALAENLRRSIEKVRWRQTNSGKEIGQVTISIGVTAIQVNEPIDKILGRCDVALYQAKSQGRNRTRVAQ